MSVAVSRRRRHVSRTGPSTSSDAGAGSRQVTLTGVPAGCTGGSWTATGNGPWIAVSPASGTGAASVTVSWPVREPVRGRRLSGRDAHRCPGRLQRGRMDGNGRLTLALTGPAFQGSRREALTSCTPSDAARATRKQTERYRPSAAMWASGQAARARARCQRAAPRGRLGAFPQAPTEHGELPPVQPRQSSRAPWCRTRCQR